VIIVDTSGLLSAVDASQRWHREAAAALRAARPPWVLSPFVLAELDYLLATRVGVHAELAMLAEVARGVYQLESFGPDDIEDAGRVIGRYRDLGIGLADASLVVIASRYGVCDLLTLDERHFRAMRGPRGRPFRIRPADG
jgi:predicted nucleic acid-binding protein